MATHLRPTLLVASIIAALSCPPCLIAQTAAPWFGTWTVNLAKSSYGAEPPPFKNATLKIEPAASGVKVTYDLVRPRGGITHLEWTGSFDGRDYPVQGIDDYVITDAYRRLDDRTCQVVQKVDGIVSATARMTISPDGKTLTTVTEGTAGGQTGVSTTVYERR